MKNDEYFVLSGAQIKKLYGPLKPRKVVLDSKKVPIVLHPLIPYAEVWGITDDVIRETIVQGCPTDIAKNLKRLVAEYKVPLNEWLAGPEALSENPSKEYIAFSAMRMAADFA